MKDKAPKPNHGWAFYMSLSIFCFFIAALLIWLTIQDVSLPSYEDKDIEELIKDFVDCKSKSLLKQYPFNYSCEQIKIMIDADYYPNERKERNGYNIICNGSIVSSEYSIIVYKKPHYLNYYLEHCVGETYD